MIVGQADLHMFLLDFFLLGYGTTPLATVVKLTYNSAIGTLATQLLVLAT